MENIFETRLENLLTHGVKNKFVPQEDKIVQIKTFEEKRMENSTK